MAPWGIALGLLVSIPIIMWGSQMVIKLMERFPVIIMLGAMLLGWIAGSMAVDDPALLGWAPALEQAAQTTGYVAGAIGALIVLAVGQFMKSRQAGQPMAQDVEP